MNNLSLIFAHVIYMHCYITILSDKKIFTYISSFLIKTIFMQKHVKCHIECLLNFNSAGFLSVVL